MRDGKFDLTLHHAGVFSLHAANAVADALFNINTGGRTETPLAAAESWLNKALDSIAAFRASMPTEKDNHP